MRGDVTSTVGCVTTTVCEGTQPAVGGTVPVGEGSAPVEAGTVLVEEGTPGTAPVEVGTALVEVGTAPVEAGTVLGLGTIAEVVRTGQIRCTLVVFRPWCAAKLKIKLRVVRIPSATCQLTHNTMHFSQSIEFSFCTKMYSYGPPQLGLAPWPKSVTRMFSRGAKSVASQKIAPLLSKVSANGKKSRLFDNFQLNLMAIDASAEGTSKIFWPIFRKEHMT